jgi:hypothetical protein
MKYIQQNQNYNSSNYQCPDNMKAQIKNIEEAYKNKQKELEK